MSPEQTRHPGREADLRGVELLTNVATQFYLRGRTQVEIARDLGLDPSTVSRHLRRAREEGIVRVEIRPPRRESIDLARALAERYGISRVLVATSDGTGLAALAADYLAGVVRSGMRIGVGWGQTLSSVVQLMVPGEATGLTICQLAGGLVESTPGIEGHELVRQLATLYPESRVQYLHAPSVVDSPEIRDAIMADSSVEGALAIAASSDLALVGIGSMDAEATMVRSGIVGIDERRLLIERHAVGSMNTRFYDASGQPVTCLDDRTIAISWDQLRRIPLVVAVAGGRAKAAAIAAALRTGCVSALITDEGAARLLVAEATPVDRLDETR